MKNVSNARAISICISVFAFLYIAIVLPGIVRGQFSNGSQAPGEYVQAGARPGSSGYMPKHLRRDDSTPNRIFQASAIQEEVHAFPSVITPNRVEAGFAPEIEPIPQTFSLNSLHNESIPDSHTLKHNGTNSCVCGGGCVAIDDACFSRQCAQMEGCCPWNLRSLLDLRNYEFFYGTQAFTGQPNYPNASTERGLGGSFGIHEGFNFASDIPCLFCDALTGQFGLRATQNQWSGSDLDSGRRDQIFLTGGFFRRVDYGLQGGVVVDYLNEQTYFDARLVQLRGELSYVMSTCDEFGFRFTSSLQDDAVVEQFQTSSGSTTTANSIFTSLDTYRFYYRRKLGENGNSQLTASVGWTEDNDAIFDSNIVTPINGIMGLRTSATYLSPASNSTLPEQRLEAWNLSLSIVLTPGRCFGSGNRYLRPFFDVADNGSFLIKRLR